MPRHVPLSRKITAGILSSLLVWTNLWATWLDGRPPSLDQLIDGPYLVLLERSHELNFSDRALDQTRDQLKREEKSEKKRLKGEEKALKKQLKGLRKDLEDLNKTGSSDSTEMRNARSGLHCQIQALERSLEEKKRERKNGLPVAYDNREAKLDLIQEWPSQQREIWGNVQSGQARLRKHGDVEASVSESSLKDRRRMSRWAATLYGRCAPLV